MRNIFTATVAATLLMSCNGNGNKFDASGTFEATEIMVPAEANGVIESFNINEGETLDSGHFCHWRSA